MLRLTWLLGDVGLPLLSDGGNEAASRIVCNLSRTPTLWARFKVRHGEVVGTIGRNGAGKSTLRGGTHEYSG